MSHLLQGNEFVRFCIVGVQSLEMGAYQFDAWFDILYTLYSVLIGCLFVSPSALFVHLAGLCRGVLDTELSVLDFLVEHFSGSEERFAPLLLGLAIACCKACHKLCLYAPCWVKLHVFVLSRCYFLLLENTSNNESLGGNKMLYNRYPKGEICADFILMEDS